MLSFGALGYLGWQIYLSAPPIPRLVETVGGDVVYTGEQVQRGEQTWLSAEVVHSRVMETLVWMRLPGDVVFAAGSVFLALHALKLLRKREAAKAPFGALPATAKP